MAPRLLAVALAALLASGLALPARAEVIAVLQGLDKITARISTIDAPVGQSVRFGSLLMLVEQELLRLVQRLQQLRRNRIFARKIGRKRLERIRLGLGAFAVWRKVQSDRAELDLWTEATAADED